jgi:hypothetical protein
MHSHHHHREHQVSHRRVHHVLKGGPAGEKKHNHSPAFSKVTSKSAAEHHDDVHGGKAAKRYARGGRTKGHKGQQTNIAIVMPHKGAAAGAGAPPMLPGAAGPGGPPMPLPGGPPGGPPGMPPPGMPPMRARGGRTIDGEATEGNIKKWSKRASSNSYFRGGAATGVGREEKAEHIKRRKK